MSRTSLLWILWALLTLASAGAVLAKLYIGGDRTVLLPGQTAGAHHQLEIACETCHTSDPFDSVATIRKDINKTCTTCHEDELKEADDSHPKKKFTNPRMASYWEKIDGRFCTSCHVEHNPEITGEMMLTLQGDYCVACHSEGEQDIRVDRPSHADLTFDTCASAGCHNYHDNRGIYEDFLVKHADQPWLADHPVLEAAALPPAPRATEVTEIEAYLALADAEAKDDQIAHDWAASAHATAEVTCLSCHAPEALEDGAPEELKQTAWVDHPSQEVCSDCHKGQAKSFSLGRHGMRSHSKIAKPRDAQKQLKKLGWKNPPEAVIATLQAYIDDPDAPEIMTTDEARISLIPDAHGEAVTCISCHGAHKEEPQVSAVTACLSCHGDDHSQSYELSPHAALWAAELSGSADPGTGVTCATCHMPQEEKKGLAVTNHNQNDNLRPNEKMIRTVCLDCHGLGFTIDALADPALVANNFKGQPSRHIESIDWATSRVEPSEQGANQ
jgi:mono/diheme cytochrome c family protein